MQAILLAFIGLILAALPASATSPARVPPGERVMCAKIYAPVCARCPDGFLCNFGNACEARANGARVLYSGRCKRPRRAR